MKRAVASLSLLLAVATGCSPASRPPQAKTPAATTPAAAATADAATNGKSIFLTGRDSNGTQIVAQHPPLYPRCAACHRADGSGGVHLPGGAVSADLRHKALVTTQAHPYTLALLERAVATGIDDDGKPLSTVMPRWRLSKRDLHDVAYYVLTKLK